MSGEPIDTTSHTHSQLSKDIQNNTKWICEDKEEKESKIAELEERIRKLEKFHESQEELYGVTSQRKMLDEVISKLCLNVDSIEDNPNYRPYT